jgi:hypothetical protein
MLEEDFSGLRKNFSEIYLYSKRNNYTKIFLSTEGIYNHWNDFSDKAIDELVRIKEYYDVRVWCVFRNPLSFALSLYTQLLKNAPSNFTPLYGTAMALEDIIDHPWFQTQLNYVEFIKSVEMAFSSPVLKASCYESGDVLQTACSIVGISMASLEHISRKNRSLSTIGIDMLRRLNSLNRPNDERQKLVQAIIRIDEILKETGRPLQASSAVKKKIMKISNESKIYLKKRFGISWNL